MPLLTIASAICRISVSLMLQPNVFHCSNPSEECGRPRSPAPAPPASGCPPGRRARSRPAGQCPPPAPGSHESLHEVSNQWAPRRGGNAGRTNGSRRHEPPGVSANNGPPCYGSVSRYSTCFHVLDACAEGPGASTRQRTTGGAPRHRRAGRQAGGSMEPSWSHLRHLTSNTLAPCPMAPGAAGAPVARSSSYPSGSLRVRVYAGIDPVSKRRRSPHPRPCPPGSGRGPPRQAVPQSTARPGYDDSTSAPRPPHRLGRGPRRSWGTSTAPPATGVRPAAPGSPAPTVSPGGRCPDRGTTAEPTG